MRILLLACSFALLGLTGCGRGEYSKALPTNNPPAPINPTDPGAMNGGGGTTPNPGGGGTTNPGGGGGGATGGGGSGGGSGGGAGPGGGAGGGGGQPVPEPSTLLLVGSGLASIAMMRRRRNAKPTTA